MFNLFSKSANNKIGLDISPEGIAMSILEKNKEKILLNNLVFHEFDSKVYQDGQPANIKELSEEIKNLVNQQKPETKSTVISVPSSSVFMKKITMPDIPEEELKIILPQEAAKHLPLNPKEMNIDFQVLKNSRRQDTSGKKIDVIICALSKQTVRNYLDAISNAGLQVQAVDISSFAMIRALGAAELINDPEKTYLSVLIDYLGTDINIIQKGMPVFSHNIQTGKKNIIENIANVLNKKKDQIKNLMPEVALLLPGEDMSENPEINKASNAAKSVVSNVSGEIQKTIEFFNSESEKPVEIERVYIGGKGVCIKNIDKYISQKIRIETDIFNPIKIFSKENTGKENLCNEKDQTFFTTCIGLALKETEN